MNAVGTPPFQGTIIGVPKDFASLVLVAIDQSYPFAVSIGILDTEIWQESVLPYYSLFWVELRDRQNLAGNVTINVSKSVCDKSQETDNSYELRADLKVVQSSFIIKNLKEEDKVSIVLLVTNAVYAVFNGVEDLKSVEFIGFRDPFGPTLIPLFEEQTPRKLSRNASRIWEEFETQYFECAEGECIIMDLILTMYGLDLEFKGLNFDDSLHYGLILAAQMVEQQSGYAIRAARSIRPAAFNGETSLGGVLCAIAILIFLIAAFYNLFRSPSKSLVWKVRENITLGLVTSSVYMETQDSYLD